MFLESTEVHNFKLWLNYGNGSKIKGELLALYGLVFSTSNFGIPTLQILVDSMVIVNYENNRSSIWVLSLDQWRDIICFMFDSFVLIKIDNVYRENNVIVDCLSKKVVGISGVYFF